MRALGELFARQMAKTSTTMLGVGIQIHFCGAAMQSWADARASIQDVNGCYRLMSADEAGPWALLEFRPDIAFWMIERLLGGCGQDSLPGIRPLTPIDRRLLLRVANLAACVLADATGTAIALGAQLDQAPLPNDSGRQAAVLSFGVTAGPCTGSLCLLLPQEHLGALLPPQDAPAGGPLELSVSLPEIAVGQQELATLEVGDVLATEQPSDGEVIIRIGGIPKFAARLGTYEGRRAVTIVRRL